MPTVQEIESLKRDVETLKEETARIQGTLEHLKKKWRNTHDLERELKNLRREKKKLETKYHEKLSTFTKSYEGLFETA